MDSDFSWWLSSLHFLLYSFSYRLLVTFSVIFVIKESLNYGPKSIVLQINMGGGPQYTIVMSNEVKLAELGVRMHH